VQRFWTFLLATSFVLAFAACQKSGPDTVKVTGKITYDGVPAEEGDITFIPPEPGGYSTSAPIGAGGVYTMDATPGEKRVEIRATRVVPGKANTDNPGSTDPAMEMYIPAKYNVDSTLKQTVSPDGGTIDFALEK
jgi:hypothetical protein